MVREQRLRRIRPVRSTKLSSSGRRRQPRAGTTFLSPCASSSEISRIVFLRLRLHNGFSPPPLLTHTLTHSLTRSFSGRASTDEILNIYGVFFYLAFLSFNIRVTTGPLLSLFCTRVISRAPLINDRRVLYTSGLFIHTRRRLGRRVVVGLPANNAQSTRSNFDLNYYIRASYGLCRYST